MQRMKPAYNNYIASLSAKEAANARKNYGVDVAHGGKTLRMMTRPLKRAEGELIPQQAINAAAADLRVFNASPGDFASGLPKPEDTLVWDGNSYTVVFAVNSEMSSIPISLKIFAYRSPQPDSAGDETPAEAAQATTLTQAGERRVYAPPASTI